MRVRPGGRRETQNVFAISQRYVTHPAKPLSTRAFLPSCQQSLSAESLCQANLGVHTCDDGVNNIAAASCKCYAKTESHYREETMHVEECESRRRL
jgi:hypothetical protein